MSPDLDLSTVDPRRIDDAVGTYEERGFVVVAGLDDLADRFRAIVTALAGMPAVGSRDFFDPNGPPHNLSRDARQRLARASTGAALSDTLLSRLEPVLVRLIGPFVHVSSTYHAQIKGGQQAEPVDHGGYLPGADFMEVHGRYLLHQDFAGASLPTSPSAVTLWLGLNSAPDWPLRLYPGSHRLGLICHRWLDADEPNLRTLAPAVEVPAHEGTAVLFHGLILHGTGEGGPSRRLSCDVRFFPVSGFLPSEVHALGDDPFARLAAGLDEAPGPTVRAALLESSVLLGQDPPLEAAPPASVLTWVSYLAHLVGGDEDGAVGELRRFVNDRIAADPADTFVSRLHGHPIHPEPLRAVRDRLAARFAGRPELDRLDRFLQRLAGAPA